MRWRYKGGSDAFLLTADDWAIKLWQLNYLSTETWLWGIKTYIMVNMLSEINGLDLRDVCLFAAARTGMQDIYCQVQTNTVKLYFASFLLVKK